MPFGVYEAWANKTSLGLGEDKFKIFEPSQEVNVMEEDGSLELKKMNWGKMNSSFKLIWVWRRFWNEFVTILSKDFKYEGNIITMLYHITNINFDCLTCSSLLLDLSFNLASTFAMKLAGTRCSNSSMGVYIFKILHICNGFNALHISQTLATSSSVLRACNRWAAWMIGCNVFFKPFSWLLEFN